MAARAHDTGRPTGWLQLLEPTVQEAQEPFGFSTSKSFLLTKLHRSPPRPNTALEHGKEPDSPPSLSSPGPALAAAFIMLSRAVLSGEPSPSASKDTFERRASCSCSFKPMKLSKSLSQENLLKVAARRLSLLVLAPSPPRAHLRKDEGN